MEDLDGFDDKLFEIQIEVYWENYEEKYCILKVE
jgi:hypothetical protein